VIAVVNFGRDNGLPIAIRGGGHNGPGLGSVDRGLVIDLSPMKGVRVDPAARTARVGPGCTQGDVDHATHAFGLTVPAGIISTTGIAGLTLSGGHGYLSRKYGLTIDNLLEADVVLADGSFVTASKEMNDDLLWALRGGGGNFGVVTSFLFQLHPVKIVFAGPIAWDQRHARPIMQRYRELLRKLPEELGAFVGLKKIPSSAPFPQDIWGKHICLLMSCYNGPEADGKMALAPLLEGLPQPFFNWMSVMPCPAVQSMFDALYPKGMQWYWRGDFVKTLSDGRSMPILSRPLVFCIQQLIPDQVASRARPASRSAGGAPARPPVFFSVKTGSSRGVPASGLKGGSPSRVANSSVKAGINR
jgi:hypothetical protein